MKKNNKNLFFILDVDGVLTSGQFIYSERGKVQKIFGAHDSDGLDLIKNHLKILFISSDKRGFKISSKRVKDMGFKLYYVANQQRFKFVEKYNFQDVIFMGDGVYDAEIIKNSKYGIAPRNAVNEAKKKADYITKRNGGDGAVYEACLHLLRKIIK
jgi:3-deoxy-D-manno-octulosonate 8-phosphate phosphatase (KDO 8-P phosphatase)